MAAIAAHPSLPQVLQPATLILRRVTWAADDPDSHTLIRMLPALLQAMVDHRGQPVVMENCMVCLRNLACSQQNKEKLKEVAVGPVRSALEAHGDRPVVAEAAMWFLSNLAEREEVGVRAGAGQLLCMRGLVATL